MQQYELTLIFKPNLTEDEADAIINKLKLSVVHRQMWGKRLLAYPINNEKEGMYMYLVIEMNASDIASLEEKIRLDEHIMRHLLVTAEKHMAVS
ncbi:30S ribosomal protein S6 [Candidatus Roizmanbacteria bacterium]|nr:30S ribosomal protein S6 [Candidatus Roizmanbacteria bacterium]